MNLVDTREKSWEALFPGDGASVAFDRPRFDQCPGPLPASGIVTHGLYIAPGEPSAAFSNITMGVVVDNTLWVGTFAGNRIAYRALGMDTGQHSH